MSGPVCQTRELRKPDARLTIATAARRLGVTWRSARKNVDKLVAADILREIDSPGRSRLFMARGIIEAIESPAPTS